MHSKKGGLGDELLDYIIGKFRSLQSEICRLDVTPSVALSSFWDKFCQRVGGPKLRRWYGEEDRLPGDGEFGDEPEEPEKEDNTPEANDAVLVLDAESAMGEQILLQLILARAAVRAAVQDEKKAKTSYGPYVTPVRGDSLQQALRGAQAVICPGKLGNLLQVAPKTQVQHLILLSSVGLLPVVLHLD